jgi:hypothetical protein
MHTASQAAPAHTRCHVNKGHRGDQLPQALRKLNSVWMVDRDGHKSDKVIGLGLSGSPEDCGDLGSLEVVSDLDFGGTSSPWDVPEREAVQ